MKQDERPLLVWDDLSQIEKAALKVLALSSLYEFTRIFFQIVQGQRFVANWHHIYMCQILESVYRLEKKRVILNCPPGGTKSELVCVHFPAWAIFCNACDPNAGATRWLPLSYSADLVDENSEKTKEIINSQAFQELCQLEVSKTFNQKNNWLFFDTHLNKHRLFGTTLFGQATGRRAGYMEAGFSGALLADDLMPPKAAGYFVQLDKCNKAFNRIARSRLAHDDVPIVVIQQRVDPKDTTFFLTSDKSPDDWELFVIPSRLDRAYIDSLPADIKALAIEQTGFTGKPVSYWESKEPLEMLNKFEKADSFLFNAQYQQAPDDEFQEGVVFRQEMELLIEDGRLCRIPIERSLPVYSFWDLGLNDHMVYILMQAHRKEIRLIDCYGNNDESMESFLIRLVEFKEKWKIHFGGHFGPHDLLVRDLMHKESRKNTANKMGFKFKPVPRTDLKITSIRALKAIFPRLWIDSRRCEKLVEAAKKYRREYDHVNEVFKNDLVKNWATDYMDAAQQIGLAWPGFESSKEADGEKSGPRHSKSGMGWMRS